MKHARYGLATVGGFDRKKQTISLHEYRANKRLTQATQVKDCRPLTWVAWRSWFIATSLRTGKGKGSHPAPAPTRNVFPSTA